MSTIIITIQSTDDVTLTDGPNLTPNAIRKATHRALSRVESKVAAAASGFGQSRVQVVTLQSTSGGTQGTGTIAVGAGNCSDGDTLTLAGNVFTFKSSVPDPASNPTQIPIGAANTDTANNILAAINLYGPTRGLGVATVSTNTVTWTENIAGQSGKYMTMTTTAANITLSGASITNGTPPTFYGAAYYPMDNQT